MFHRLSFEQIIEEVRATVARHLWRLVVEKADLRGHLRALKDYFLSEASEITMRAKFGPGFIEAHNMYV